MDQKNAGHFCLNKNLVFVGSMQFISSSLDKLVKNLSDKDVKYLVKEFGSKHLELLKQKGAYPYEHMNSFEKFEEKELSNKESFFSSTKKGKIGDNGEKLDGHINDEKYYENDEANNKHMENYDPKKPSKFIT